MIPQISLSLLTPNNPHLQPTQSSARTPQKPSLPVSPRRATLPEMPSTVPGLMVSPRKLEHINCVIEKSGGEGGLYIGDTISSLKWEYIEGNNI